MAHQYSLLAFRIKRERSLTPIEARICRPPYYSASPLKRSDENEILKYHKPSAHFEQDFKIVKLGSSINYFTRCGGGGGGGRGQLNVTMRDVEQIERFRRVVSGEPLLRFGGSLCGRAVTSPVTLVRSRRPSLRRTGAHPPSLSPRHTPLSSAPSYRFCEVHDEKIFQPAECSAHVGAGFVIE
ncbi:hypothetical protein EVAR_95417_1 [Eumeta japonica]|uniref:Uncharacterized protein n=1 Tax=Eumeta variegata TaxID=151549 RepID=A0A4C1VHV0_EUMVA|nr:hypothetical protein EVAR_95417_1 [Eumeta japonica]